MQGIGRGRGIIVVKKPTPTSDHLFFSTFGSSSQEKTENEENEQQNEKKQLSNRKGNFKPKVNRGELARNRATDQAAYVAAAEDINIMNKLNLRIEELRKELKELNENLEQNDKKRKELQESKKKKKNQLEKVKGRVSSLEERKEEMMQQALEDERNKKAKWVVIDTLKVSLETKWQSIVKEHLDLENKSKLFNVLDSKLSTLQNTYEQQSHTLMQEKKIDQ